MPHTNRKKKGTGLSTKPKTIQHTKRQEVEDADGWTHVVDAPSSRKVNLEKLSKLQAQTGDFELNGVSYVNRTLEELGRDLEYYTRKWEESEACKGLREILERGDGKVVVKDVVCLGLGSLMIARREQRRSSFTQLAALRTILGAFELSNLVLQDPTFTPLEITFLTSLGYTVVEDPTALAHIKESTLVYAIHCYTELYEAVASKGQPAMVVMNDLEEYANPGIGVEEMVEGCEGLKWPLWKGDIYRADFAFTKIYWRKTGESVKEQEKSEGHTATQEVKGQSTDEQNIEEVKVAMDEVNLNEPKSVVTEINPKKVENIEEDKIEAPKIGATDADDTKVELK